jgi:hypothetical protein
MPKDAQYSEQESKRFEAALKAAMEIRWEN